MRFLKVFLVVVLLSVISSAFAQSNTLSLWARNTFTHDVYQNPDIGINLVHNFKDSKQSFAGFANIFKNWGEAYIGPRYTFNNNVCASVYAGLETVEDWWRIAGDLNIAYKAINWYNVYEYGSSGFDGDYWFSDLTFALNSSIKLEAKAYKIGSVVRLGGGGIYSIPKTPVAISPVALWNFDSKKAEAEAVLYFNF